VQDHTILIGGLDKTYMQKLVLYLNERLDNGMRVELAESPESSETKSGEPEGIISDERKKNEKNRRWDAVIGTEAFVAEMEDQAVRSIIFSEEEAEDETHIYPYQSRDTLYRKIVSRCVLRAGKMAGNPENKKSKMYVFTGAGNVGQLSAFAALCAWMWSREIPVLYLDLAECSGIAQLLHLQENESDLSDLILALRREEDLYLGGYVGRTDRLDYICPTRNPQVLHEMDEADVRRLLHCILNRKETLAVLALGTMVRGCEQIFMAADRIFLLSEEGVIEECALEERRMFIQKCVGDRSAHIEKISIRKLRADTTGSQLLYEWMETEVGKQAAQLQREKENKYGDNLAVSAETDFGEN